MFLNPLSPLNELVLGQRLPEDTFVCQSCPTSLMERSFVLCRDCKTLHDGRIWSGRNSLGHWFGLVCPSCSKSLPANLSIASRILLGITFPFWFLPARQLRSRWLKFEHNRAIQVQSTPKRKLGMKEWLVLGTLGWGVPFWLMMSLIAPFLGPSRSNSGYWATWWGAAPKSLPICLVGGFFVGLIMGKKMLRKGGKGPEKSSDDSIRKTGS